MKKKRITIMKHWNDENITSHHITGGFWAHITWKGNNGVDQQGRKWSNPANPQPEFHPVIIEIMKMPAMIAELRKTLYHA